MRQTLSISKAAVRQSTHGLAGVERAVNRSTLYQPGVRWGGATALPDGRATAPRVPSLQGPAPL